MAEPAFSVCVYCGSRPGDNPAYAQVAQAVGQWIGAHHGQLVYGGGRSGLMGTVAEATRLAGGRVVGVLGYDPARDEVVLIRQALAVGIRQCVLAQTYGVSDSTVSLIARAKTWRHVR